MAVWYTHNPVDGPYWIVGDPTSFGGGVTVTPNSGVLALVGYASLFPLEVRPFTGSLVLSAYNELISLGLQPGTSALILSGQQAQRADGIQPATGALLLTPYDPIVSQTGLGTTVFPTQGALAISGGVVGISAFINLGATVVRIPERTAAMLLSRRQDRLFRSE